MVIKSQYIGHPGVEATPRSLFILVEMEGVGILKITKIFQGLG